MANKPQQQPMMKMNEIQIYKTHNQTRPRIRHRAAPRARRRRALETRCDARAQT
jgi:hypothetical protein